MEGLVFLRGQAIYPHAAGSAGLFCRQFTQASSHGREQARDALVGNRRDADHFAIR